MASSAIVFIFQEVGQPSIDWASSVQSFTLATLLNPIYRDTYHTRPFPSLAQSTTLPTDLGDCAWAGSDGDELEATVLTPRQVYVAIVQVIYNICTTQKSVTKKGVV